MNDRQWAAAHKLAAELAQRNFDGNLLRTAGEFIKSYPEQNLLDWLERLTQLGDLFGSSLQTGRYRHELNEAIKRLNPTPRQGDWPLVLAWAYRLLDFYQQYPNLARKVSDIKGLRLPDPPAPFVPPAPKPRQKKKASADTDTPPQSETEEVSEASNEIFARFQQIWAEREQKKKD